VVIKIRQKPRADGSRVQPFKLPSSRARIFPWGAPASLSFPLTYVVRAAICARSAMK